MLIVLSIVGRGIYWLLPSQHRWYWLIVSSLCALFYIAPMALVVLSMMLVLTYLARTLPKIVIGLLIGNLLFWKVWMMETLLGLSFVTFFLIHYVVDIQRKKIPSHSLLQLGSRVFFIPILTAGPIERFQHFLEGQASQPLWERAGSRLALGIIQKWLMGEGVVRLYLNGWNGSMLAEQGNTLDSLTLWSVLAGLFVQLYCDFAGYSNIAIGVSALFGFDIADNFRSPLLATNPADFWKRWHISLSGWCQEYVYLPVLGLTRNPYLGIVGTFLVMGLWHSVSWHWVLWGGCHSLALIVHLRWRRLSRQWSGKDTLIWKGVSWVFLMLFLSLTSSLTQVHGYGSIEDSFALIGRAFGVH